MNPLTLEIPKALLHLAGKTLLEWSIDRLHSAGCTDIVVAVGWKRDLIEKSIASLERPFPIHTIRVPDYERGALQTFTTATTLVHGTINILNPVDLVTSSKVVESVISAHPKDNPFGITLLVDYSITSEHNVSVGSDKHIITIHSETMPSSHNAKSAMLMAFSSGFPTYCEESLRRGDTTVFSALNSLIDSQNSVFACPINEQWYDVDTIGDALRANRYLLETSVVPDHESIFIPRGDLMEVGDSISLSSGISFDKGVVLKGPCLIQRNSQIGASCTIGPNVSLAESTIIESNSVVHDVSIFGDSVISTNSKINNALVFKSQIYSWEV